MNHPFPLVSIVIPCYRGEKYLPAAIESCLGQTYPRLEVIVVDDASPGRDAAIAAEYTKSDSRIKLVRRSENGRIARALNSGYAIAGGEFFTRLAQDDLFRLDAIALLVKQLQDHPAAGLAYADMQLIDAEGKFLQMMPTNPPATALLPANRVGLCFLWRRSAWEAVGPFDPHYDLCEDYEFLLRLARRFPLCRLEGEAPFFFRYHPEQASVEWKRAHDIARARVLLAHNLELFKGRWYAPLYWKRLLTGRLRLWRAYASR